MKLLRAALLFGIAVVAVVVGLVLSATIEASIPIPRGPSQAASASSRVLDPTCSCAPDEPSHEEAAIESMVRRYRPAAEEAWIRTLTEAICVESLSADVDPLMTASIIASESSFQGRVVSDAGAVGLMQLRLFVAQDVAGRRQIAWRGVETLYSPELNVRLGVLYFTELIERFDGDLQKALTAYNYGPTRVSRMIRAGEYEGSRYAETILERYERLRSICERQDSAGLLSANAPASRCATSGSRPSPVSLTG